MTTIEQYESAAASVLPRALSLREDLLQLPLIGAATPYSVAEAIMAQAEANLESLREELKDVHCELI